jgi:pyridine nucleotide-disulfide oxidoreductase family protein
VKRILLVGGGHAHLAVLRSLVPEPLDGARFALVSPRAKQIYSGMLPGVIAGHYRRHEAEIDLARLAEAAYVEFIEDEVAKLEPERKVATLKDGSELEYDAVSLNVGSLVERSIPGAGLALAAKPFEEFFDKLRNVKVNRVAIAGAGAAGAELAMALRHRGAAVTLYSEQARLSPPRLEAVLRGMGVDLRPGMAMTAIEPGPQVIAGPSRQEFDVVLLTTGAAPLPWLRGSALERDERGFVLVDDTLQSVSHPEVFGAGDCATLRSGPVPKSGVYSLRQGETLAANFRRLVSGEPLVAYRAQRHALMLLSCGRRYAIAQRGGWSAQGRWVWWWKDRIDRKWVRSLTI